MLLLADYQNAVIKLQNLGLNIALPPDLIGDGKYTRLSNLRTLQEGQLTTRFGLNKLFSRPATVAIGSTIRYMARVSGEKMLFVWSDGEVFIDQQPLTVYDYFQGVGDPRGSFQRQNLILTYPKDYEVQDLQNQPAVDNVSVVRFISKVSGEDWTFLATDVGMWKIDKDGIGWKWGIRPPVSLVTNVDNTQVPPVTTYDFAEVRFGHPEDVACPPDAEGDLGCELTGSGQLKTPYVWVYTYYSSNTGAESNACGEMTETIDMWSTGTCPDPYNPPTNISQPNASCVRAVKLTPFQFPTDPQVDRYRIYRKGGGLPTYRLEDEIPIYVQADPNVPCSEANPCPPTTYYISYKSDIQIAGNQPLSEENYVPFTTTVSPSGSPDPYGYKSTDPLITPEISDSVSQFETPMGRTWGPYQGAYIFATGDPNRPGVVYWTNAGQPDGSGLLNELQVTSALQPLIAGFIFGGNSFVWSRDELYALDYSGQSTPEFIPRQIPMGLGLSAPNAFAVGPNGVYFLAKDGIYVTDCTTFANTITKDSLRPIFLGQSASEFQPVDWNQAEQFKMSVVSQELHFLYLDTAGLPQHLVYDIQHQRWQKFIPSIVEGLPSPGVQCFMVDCVPPAVCVDTPEGASCRITRYATAIFGDLNSAQYNNFIALNDGNVYKLAYEATGKDEYEYDLGQDIPVKFRTGAADAGNPLTQKEFGLLMIDADIPASSECEVTAFYDAEQVQGPSFSLATVGRQTKTFSLNDVYKKNLSLDFEWHGLGTIYQITVQWRLDEEEVVHWFAPADALGIRGWKHVRDGYFGLRSTGVVVLTVVVDGDKTYTYDIPPTGGELLAPHIWFDAVKGKMYQYSLDSKDGVTPFRVYSDDTFVNVKQWNTANTYNPFKLGGSGGYSTGGG